MMRCYPVERIQILAGMLLIFLLPLSLSAKWHPKYWNIYGDFSAGINYTEHKTFMSSGSANVSVNHFYAGASVFSLGEASALGLVEYAFNAGVQISDHKHFFAVAGPGIGRVTYNDVDANGVPIRPTSLSLPILAKFYYTPTKWLGIHTQVFYTLNTYQNYWGATAGISLGLFHWTNIRYTR